MDVNPLSNVGPDMTFEKNADTEHSVYPRSSYHFIQQLTIWNGSLQFLDIQYIDWEEQERKKEMGKRGKI